MNTIKQSLGKVSITVEKNYWSNTNYYDRLVLVEHDERKRVYISRKPVPAGTNIDDREYWIPICRLDEELVVEWNTIRTSYNNLSQALREYQEAVNNIIININTNITKLAQRVTNLENGGSHTPSTGEVERPELTEADAGYQHYDVELNIPIWWTGTKWVDAIGNDVTTYTD